LVRARDAAVADLRRKRQLISAFLLRQGRILFVSPAGAAGMPGGCPSRPLLIPRTMSVAVGFEDV
jgi:hypothetical protein